MKAQPLLDNRRFKVTVQTGDETHLRRNVKTVVYDSISADEARCIERASMGAMRGQAGGCVVLTEPLPESCEEMDGQ